MRLFSTILNFSDKLNKDAFIGLVVKWNLEAKYKENIVPGVAWNGEENIKFGTDRLSIEIIDYSEKDILAVRHEKITDDEVVWDTDFVVNFAERKISIRLDRTFSEDALEMNAAFSTPHFISLLIEHGYLKDDQDLPVLRDPIIITDSNLETIRQGVNSAVLSDNLQNQIQRLAEAESAKQSAEEEINQVYEEFDEDIVSFCAVKTKMK